ncbi:MAG: hypothetical protein DRP93_02165 [Candidatus Neomarinimicrobiota bacterium]|nr:DUF819 family protein [Candidatus Neomarinimicrobiota bacterium]RKY56042.1 MAG: hypothetical protein DRP93_02165 [Candidatus Neomarinimicrobiota bacterium]
MEGALIKDQFGLLAILMIIPAVIYAINNHTKWGKKFFGIVPPLVFAYFIPTILTSLGIIPDSAPIYRQIKTFVLPASLLLLTLAIDVKGIMKLGSKALIMFLTGTLGIVIGGPISLLIFKNALPPEIWKGMAALAGSWIGGGANFIAIGQSVGTSESMMGVMVIVDVLAANILTGILFFLAGRSDKIDARLGADNSAIKELQEKVVLFQKKTTRVTTVTDYFVMLALAFGCSYIAYLWGNALPNIGDIISHSTWKVIIITTMGVGLSFTPIKNYEGAGASKLGTVMLYLLIGVIGASANLKAVMEYPALFGMGLTWLAIHLLILFVVMKLIKAPLFFMAVGSQANVGGAASAPIVASAFHPALASVGVMLGIAGYVLGTYAALLCAKLLLLVS